MESLFSVREGILLTSIPHTHIHMVNIHLQMTDGQWVHALSIPCEDIERISALHPLKWLRFVTFAAVGARGHLSPITDGNGAVDYEIELTDLAEDYYFTPEGNAPTPPTILYLQGIAKQGSTILSISTD